MKLKLSGNITGDILSPRGFPQATLVLCPWQKKFLLVMLFILLGLLLWDWRSVLLGINILLTIFYLIATLHRMFIIELALRRPREIIIPPEKFSTPPNGREWPRYMVILPMYHEGEILPELIAGLQKLDYPTDRLEIRLLIEADDDETRSVAESLSMPEHFKIFLIPPSQPRTKPKACNIGIEEGEADYLVIYDAEDKPEPDQLKKAAWAFAQSPPEVACIQAKLGYYNPDWNFLTRCFTAEYATWFGLCLPGLDCLQSPIPLGGTSNHFKLDVLRQLGGWDEYNVTEDCDLGLRLFIAGWRTRILESTTWEQACPSLPFWIRQRSRWVKGYIQTYLVHTRDFWNVHRKLGFWNSLHFHLFIGGTSFSQLINPLYWFMTLAWIFLRPQGLDQFFPLPVFIMGSFCLFVGNFVFAYTSGIACVRRGVGYLAHYALLMPFYWMLMSIGAWKGFWQIISKPHHWEKTKHFANQ
ncbi:MAG: glycosyltransferase [Lentisphaerae bacterium]|nr:glycosyltransferase [Lentisphaerota bacterium]